MRTGCKENRYFPDPPGNEPAKQYIYEESLVDPGSLFCYRSQIDDSLFVIYHLTPEV